MDPLRVCGDTKTLRTSRHKHVSIPSLPPDTYQCQHWHPLALKLGCAGLILLFLGLIGLSVLVRFLVQKSPIEKHSVTAQENRTESTGRSVILKCPRDWHPYRDKCLHLSQISGPWSEGLSYCSVKEATLLLIENEEELRFIHDFSKRKRQQFFIGLNYVPPEKTWKWINGSILNPDLVFGGIALAVMELTLETKLASDSQKSTCFCLSSAGIKGVCVLLLSGSDVYYSKKKSIAIFSNVIVWYSSLALCQLPNKRRDEYVEDMN